MNCPYVAYPMRCPYDECGPCPIRALVVARRMELRMDSNQKEARE